MDSGSDTSSGEDDAPPVHYSKDKRNYPELADLMVALQEEGKRDMKSPEEIFKWPKLVSLSGKVYDKMKANSFPGLGANRSRASNALAKCIVRLRKQVDKCDVMAELQTYGPSESSTVYILQNNLDCFGFDVVLANYGNHLNSRVVQKQEDRNASDAIRVAAVMFHPDNQAAVAGILSGNKDRAKSDQSVDPVRAWAMVAIEMFKDIDFVVPTPDGMDPADIEGIDPNDVVRILMNRDPTWFLDTWRFYLKTKYKKAIKKWDKETGGGSHEAHEFSNFCDPGTRWLVWVYLMDIDHDFLLFSNAKGKPPQWVGNEAGFSSRRSADLQEGDGGSGGSDGTGDVKGSAAKSARAMHRQRDKNVNVILDKISAELDERKAHHHATSQGPGAAIIQSIRAATTLKRELEVASMCMTPRSRRHVMGDVKKQIRKLGQQYSFETRSALTSLSDDDEDDDDDPYNTPS
jgi:hypothetical protein